MAPATSRFCLHFRSILRVLQLESCLGFFYFCSSLHSTVYVGLPGIVTLNSQCSCIDSLMAIPLRALLKWVDLMDAEYHLTGWVSSGPSVALFWFLIHEYFCKWIFSLFYKLFQMPEVMSRLRTRIGVWFVLRWHEGVWGPLRTKGFLGLSWKCVLIRTSQIWHSGCS